MQHSASLQAIDPDEGVTVTVTVSGGSVSGHVAQVCDRPGPVNCVSKPGFGDPASMTFDLGKGQDLSGRTVMCDTVIANVGVGQAQPTITWTFQNAKKLFGPDVGYTASEEFPQNDTVANATFEF